MSYYHDQAISQQREDYWRKFWLSIYTQRKKRYIKLMQMHGWMPSSAYAFISWIEAGPTAESTKKAANELLRMINECLQSAATEES